MKNRFSLHRGSVAPLVAALLTSTAAAPAHTEGRALDAPPVHSFRVTEPLPARSAAMLATDAGPVTVRRWYGYQTIIADVLSTSVLFAGASSLDICISPFGPTQQNCHNDVAEMLIIGGAVGYALGGPIVHAAHGQWGKAGYSIGLRVVPAATALSIGSMLDGGDRLPLLVGGTALTATVLDSALLGYEEVAVDAPKLSMVPSYDPKTRSGSLVFVRPF